MAGPIQLITFDLDNTLWSVEEVIIAANERQRRWLEDELPGFNNAFDDHGLAALREQVIADAPELRHDLSALRIAVLARALQQFGQSVNQADELARQAFTVFLDARHQVNYYPDVEKTLAQLAARYRLAALSNGNADVSRLSIHPYFSFSYSAASVGASKPHPAMFKAALNRAGVPPEAAIHIGDQLVDDVQGAQAVGMQTIWLDQSASAPGTNNDHSGIAPDKRVERIADLCAAVDTLDNH